MTAQPRYVLPTVPEALRDLLDLALDLRWSWSHSADELWQMLDPKTWGVTHNPWHILQTISQTTLEEFAADPQFRALVKRHAKARRDTLEAKSWFAKTHPTAAGVQPAGKSGTSLLSRPLNPVAYFSMEFGLSEALPIYSGGLGILAGDFLKAASDLGVPVVGLGLLWQQGYFRQALDSQGNQIEFFPFNDPGQLPIMPLRDVRGEWVVVEIQFPRRLVRVRVWEVIAGRARLYLLDSNDLANSPADRGITGDLYGGGSEARLQQEMVLGIGGWRTLRELGIEPDVCHLNEGHAALAVLERARCFMEDTGARFEVALTATRAGNLFTTHTPVEAGFDRFPPGLIKEYLGSYAESLGIALSDLLALGQPPEIASNMPPELVLSESEPFNMAYLAIRGSGAVNGVSKLHGEVSRELFQPLFPRWPRREVPVGSVTNGVHVPSWDSKEADALWTKVCGKERWLDPTVDLGRKIREIGDEELWAFRDSNRRTLIAMAREHVRRQGPIAGSLEALGNDISCLCDPEVLTLGFARRFTSYKRVNLLLHDPARLERILCGDGSKVQLVIAGKAHPADTAGKAMIRQWTEFIARCNVRPHVLFLVDYDMAIAEHLVQGVDVWINTPRRPWEASGTSGMKVLVNGGLNLSEIDGWWAEAYSADVGWAVGDGLEHSHDAAWDAIEAERIYDLIENEIVPEYYDRDEQGIPRRWIARVRESMARLAPQYSANRMLKEYLEHYYLPGAAAYRKRSTTQCTENDGTEAASRTPSPTEESGGEAQATAADAIEAWRQILGEHWHEIRFVDYQAKSDIRPEGSIYEFRVEVDLGVIPPNAVQVELYAEPVGNTELTPALWADRRPAPPELRALQLLPAAPNRGDVGPSVRVYTGSVPATRPLRDYTPRVVPSHPGAAVPLEDNHILWYR